MELIEQILQIGGTLVAIPVVYSLVSGLIRKIADVTDPRLIVYAVSWGGTAYLMYIGSSLVPSAPVCVASAPAACITAWLLFGTSLAELTKVIYDKALKTLPVFNPDNW